MNDKIRKAVDDVVEWCCAIGHRLPHTSRIEMDARLERMRVELLQSERDNPVEDALRSLIAESDRLVERHLILDFALDQAIANARRVLARHESSPAGNAKTRTSMVNRKRAVGWCEDDDAAVDEMVASGQSRRDAVESVLQTLEHDKRCEDESR